MKYACQNIKCTKYMVAYPYLPSGVEPAEYDPELSIICTLCGYHCDVIQPDEPTPESEPEVTQQEDLGPHIKELRDNSSIVYALGNIYSAINLSSHRQPGQVRIIMRELVHAYLLDREINA